MEIYGLVAVCIAYLWWRLTRGRPDRTTHESEPTLRRVSTALQSPCSSEGKALSGAPCTKQLNKESKS